LLGSTRAVCSDTMPLMTGPALQDACEQGQRELIETRYLDAVQTLVAAESTAWDAGDFDTLSRLYLPLQEARRQARQRCGEGIVELSIVATGPDQPFDPEWIVDRYPHGQLLIAGWMSTAPAEAVREIARDRKLYVETFLAAVYPASDDRFVVVLPESGRTLPQAGLSRLELLDRLPFGAFTLSLGHLPKAPRPGTTETYAEVMGLWEQLHKPFLAAADSERSPVRRMERYRRTIAVDPACELAHQRLAAVAQELARGPAAGS
jgi:hypothetical protein